MRQSKLTSQTVTQTVVLITDVDYFSSAGQKFKIKSRVHSFLRSLSGLQMALFS
jgi:hypothetical protein